MSIRAEHIRLGWPDSRHLVSYLEARREGYTDTTKPGSKPVIPVTEKTVEQHVASLNSAPLPAVDRPVPFAHLWLTAEEEFIGRVGIRYELNEKLLRLGGHVGYEIRPRYRCQGFGHHALALAMDHLQTRGMKKILLTCNVVNIASARIIEKAGGRYENSIPHPDMPGAMLRRYWIELHNQNTNGT